MKKAIILTALVIIVTIFSNCHSRKIAAAPKMNYETNIKPIITEKCSPCHIPAKGGRTKALDTYESVSAEIDDIIRRIELHPGERGFMPLRMHRLSEDTIAIFKQWKADALIEK